MSPIQPIEMIIWHHVHDNIATLGGRQDLRNQELKQRREEGRRSRRTVTKQYTCVIILPGLGPIYFNHAIVLDMFTFSSALPFDSVPFPLVPEQISPKAVR